MSEKMMICPKHATCEKKKDRKSVHCERHIEEIGCRVGWAGYPHCVPVEDGEAHHVNNTAPSVRQARQAGEGLK